MKVAVAVVLALAVSCFGGNTHPFNPEEEFSFSDGLIPTPDDYVMDEASIQYLEEIRSDLARQALPAEYDARKLGYVSPVKNQGNCGSCAAFSSAAVVETCIAKLNQEKKMKNPFFVDLSEQYLLDYLPASGDPPCVVGAPIAHYMDAMSLESRKTGFAPHEYAYPYKNLMSLEKQVPMKNPKMINYGAKVSQALFFSQSTCTPEILKGLILKHGAVGTSVYSKVDGFQSYKGPGVYAGQDCPADVRVSHALTVVGWGVDAVDGEYFIAKNSWGWRWGDNGYIKIKHGACQFGLECAMVNCAATTVHDALPKPQAATSCFLRSNANPIWANQEYSLTILGQQRDFNCAFGNCTLIKNRNQKVPVPIVPNPHPGVNACVDICGSYYC